MKIFKQLFSLALLMVALNSCTTITSTNLPGKKENQIPKNFVGTFEIQFPKEYQDMMGEEALNMYLSFKSDRMILESKGEQTETALGDSLYFSTIGKDSYLSMGEAPSFNVFKMVPKGKDILLYAMFAQSEVTSADLSNYFKNVTEEVSEEDGSVSYTVTIDDTKLADFFKSDIAFKEPYTLKRVKKKKK